MDPLAPCLTPWTYRRKDVRARERSRASEVCYGCNKAEQFSEDSNTPGSRLKTCASCNYVKYCSTECQRRDWPSHKRNCPEFKAQGKTVINALHHALHASVPELTFCIMICAALEFEKELSISSEELVEFNKKEPLIVCINIGIEPSNIEDLVGLSDSMEEWDQTHADGLLQFHHISSFKRWTNPFGADSGIVEKENIVWKSTREHLDESKEPGIPLVMLYFLNNGNHILSYVLPVIPAAVRSAKDKVPLANQSLPLSILDDWTPTTQYKADVLNHMNEQIRADQKNILRLRTPIRQSDKMAVVRAFHLLRAPPSLVTPQLRQLQDPPSELMLLKMLREPFYMSLIMPMRHLFGGGTTRPQPSQSDGRRSTRRRHTGSL